MSKVYSVTRVVVARGAVESVTSRVALDAEGAKHALRELSHTPDDEPWLSEDLVAIAREMTNAIAAGQIYFFVQQHDIELHVTIPVYTMEQLSKMSAKKVA
ncbi:MULTISPECIES: hypothetical protein [unclassified Chelatococcus]|uniref:hypothetical protein n=1 Tax=unclassified Chelatococcus TaxID=2638111 RepID=UPI001BCE34D0|nr:MULTISPECIES: hypothetical protein [unclassified Chelatococcus]MBS7701461.1 hypothetical protein [Chelatococcus sp. YT9]MBS7743753.1 hypothetical protein [Chelatococcus sp. HY11]CAH1664900.1 hypothetical protein CHELA20_40412 [Hyphomicrobiales bacterium]CAH1688580.1 hypothetical protein CHELA41_40269 [Hyphomicrobiales bacterium]